MLRLSRCCLTIALSLAAGCGASDGVFDPQVWPADGVLVGARGSPTHGPWPRIVGERKNPGPALEFEFEGKRYRPNDFWRARQVGDELLACGKVFELPNLEPRAACYRLGPKCVVRAEFVAPYEEEMGKAGVRYFPTSQGRWLRSGRDGAGWELRREGEWKALAFAGGLEALDESPGSWFGLRELYPGTEVVAFGSTGDTLGELPLSGRATLMVSPARDKVLTTTGDQAFVWSPGQTPLDLSAATPAPDGSPESFHGATWGFGSDSNELVLWSSRELGQQTTTLDGAKNPAFQPFRVNPETGQARRAASFPSRPYDPLWVSQAIGACLRAPR